MAEVGVDWSRYDAVLFDLDGVLTPTAELHRQAWRDVVGRHLDEQGLQPWSEDDYFRHIDGRQRAEGIRAVLGSRGVRATEAEVAAVGGRKNAAFETLLAAGIAPYPASVRLLDHLATAGTGMAVVSSSRNAPTVLEAAGLADRFGLVVDGTTAEREGLAGKPAPDTYLYAARHLGVPAGRAVVVEDAVSGVESGRAGGFGLVVGVDRGVGAARLTAAGADVVVEELDELVPAG